MTLVCSFRRWSVLGSYEALLDVGHHNDRLFHRFCQQKCFWWASKFVESTLYMFGDISTYRIFVIRFYGRWSSVVKVCIVHVQVAILCQNLDEIDYATAFKALQVNIYDNQLLIVLCMYVSCGTEPLKKCCLIYFRSPLAATRWTAFTSTFGTPLCWSSSLTCGWSEERLWKTLPL